MTTAKNLKEAFAGESQANRMYLAFAKKAESDGFPQVAKLFRAAAAAETVHAHAHFRVMGGVKGTTDNLQAAIDGEGHEFKDMYPEFLSEAEKEKNTAAAVSFRNALVKSAGIPCTATRRTRARSATRRNRSSRRSSRKPDDSFPVLSALFRKRPGVREVEMHLSEDGG
jgi:hypothetical protein